MGTSRSVRYSITALIESVRDGETVRGTFDAYEWRTRKSGPFPAHGKPTAANLAKFVRQFEGATHPGGPNAHLGPTRVISAAVIDHFSDGAKVAMYACPDPERDVADLVGYADGT